jgi:hypothetical protein
MSGFYKFFNEELKGVYLGQAPSIRFGRLRYFQLCEVLYNDQFIGDRFEGAARTNIQNVVIGREDTEIKRQLEEARVVKSDGHGDIRFGHISVINEVDCFVFCLFQGPLAVGVDLYGKKDARSYDDCVQVTDIDALGAAIAAGTIGGEKVTDLFVVRGGQVGYEGDGQFAYDALLRLETGDPFRKRELYSDQQEFRFVLFPKAHPYPLCDHVDVRLAGEVPLFLHTPFDGSTRVKTLPGDPDAAIQAIDDIMAEWAAMRPEHHADFCYTFEENVRLSSEASCAADAMFGPYARRLIDQYAIARSRYPIYLMDVTLMDYTGERSLEGDFRSYRRKVDHIRAGVPLY